MSDPTASAADEAAPTPPRPRGALAWSLDVVVVLVFFVLIAAGHSLLSIPLILSIRAWAF